MMTNVQEEKDFILNTFNENHDFPRRCPLLFQAMNDSKDTKPPPKLWQFLMNNTKYFHGCREHKSVEECTCHKLIRFEFRHVSFCLITLLCYFRKEQEAKELYELGWSNHYSINADFIKQLFALLDKEADILTPDNYKDIDECYWAEEHTNLFDMIYNSGGMASKLLPACLFARDPLRSSPQLQHHKKIPVMRGMCEIYHIAIVGNQNHYNYKYMDSDNKSLIPFHDLKEKTATEAKMFLSNHFPTGWGLIFFVHFRHPCFPRPVQYSYFDNTKGLKSCFYANRRDSNKPRIREMLTILMLFAKKRQDRKQAFLMGLVRKT
jgi:hypothetical protein